MDYVIIVRLDDSAAYPALDQELIMRGFETTMEPSPATAFVLPRGVYRSFSDATPQAVHNVVAVAIHTIKTDGSILVLEKGDAEPFASGVLRHVPGNPDPVRPWR